MCTTLKLELVHPFSSSNPFIKTTKNGLEERVILALVVNRPGTLAQLAKVFAYANQSITGLCVRSTVGPELSRVTITCFLQDQELPALKKRLRALVAP
ncbi:unnamed protein product [Peronospora destructor]|uniref:ACT domain-containing protein n=1 Tax=Peronospora destructor TaxID=86335 RepID=A0AAV0V9Z3_9STRA|nr:unnamed protein product [Peronospora destructor]